MCSFVMLDKNRHTQTKYASKIRPEIVVSYLCFFLPLIIFLISVVSPNEDSRLGKKKTSEGGWAGAERQGKKCAHFKLVMLIYI